jgi:hypothetical protein
VAKWDQTPHDLPCRGDYEVDFYLKTLEDRAAGLKRGATQKNRRLAYMNRRGQRRCG